MITRPKNDWKKRFDKFSSHDIHLENPKHVLYIGATDTSFIPPLKIYCRVLQNQYIGGTKDVSVATIYRTCFGPSELKLWHFLYFSDLDLTNFLHCLKKRDLTSSERVNRGPPLSFKFYFPYTTIFRGKK
ncbi:hypothetical protein BpHYR1_038444 [Brachionus plicatilis]|uniref:Uncharacterized protein n=1 Tax=Brachionus plicatilis TaxID=10195 RepID=A0A3M7Q668_BRAPC|nr:hypothetical protein BpHYR1_038444 [Brachionus plicatilis]